MNEEDQEKLQEEIIDDENQETLDDQPIEEGVQESNVEGEKKPPLFDRTKNLYDNSKGAIEQVNKIRNRLNRVGKAKLGRNISSKGITSGGSGVASGVSSVGATTTTAGTTATAATTAGTAAAGAASTVGTTAATSTVAGAATTAGTAAAATPVGWIVIAVIAALLLILFIAVAIMFNNDPGVFEQNDPGKQAQGNVNTEYPFFAESVKSSVSSQFACREIFGKYDFHGAVDIVVVASTVVTSPLDGVVLSAYAPNFNVCGCGYVLLKVQIPDTDDYVVFRFMHLDPRSINLKSGDTVYRNNALNEYLGASSNTTVIGKINGRASTCVDTCSTGSHLDFQVYAYNSSEQYLYNPSILIKSLLEGKFSSIDSDARTKMLFPPANYDKLCNENNINRIPKVS